MFRQCSFINKNDLRFVEENERRNEPEASAQEADANEACEDECVCKDLVVPRVVFCGRGATPEWSCRFAESKTV